jgi:hypothetical protein
MSTKGNASKVATGSPISLSLSLSLVAGEIGEGTEDKSILKVDPRPPQQILIRHAWKYIDGR